MIDGLNAFAERAVRVIESRGERSNDGMRPHPESPMVERREESPRVGEYVMHPLRDRAMPVLAVGDRIWVFRIKTDKPGTRVATYEAIEGSPSFRELEEDGRFEGAFLRTEPCVELDHTNAVEQRNIVVPLKHIRRATAEEISRAKVEGLREELDAEV